MLEIYPGPISEFNTKEFYIELASNASATMYISITKIRLKHPFQIPALIRLSIDIMRQLDDLEECEGYKTRGFWLTHYTMSKWKNKEAIRAFSHSGPHLHAIKVSGRLSRQIVTTTLDADDFPSWKEAKAILLKSDPK